MVKALPIPEDEQMRALLEGRLAAVMKEYGAADNDYDFGKYVSISKGEAIKFLRDHPKLSKQFYSYVAANRGVHDVYVIDYKNHRYQVAWLDHGTPRFRTDHATLEEAIVDFLGCSLHLTW